MSGSVELLPISSQRKVGKKISYDSLLTSSPFFSFSLNNIILDGKTLTCVYLHGIKTKKEEKKWVKESEGTFREEKNNTTIV